MSSSDESPSRLKRVYRTVTPGVREQENTEMDVIGWTIFVGVLFFLLPLLPFILIVWAVTKVLDAIAGKPDGS
jgi:hypothetical protein